MNLYVFFSFLHTYLANLHSRPCFRNIYLNKVYMFIGKRKISKKNKKRNYKT